MEGQVRSRCTEHVLGSTIPWLGLDPRGPVKTIQKSPVRVTQRDPPVHFKSPRPLGQPRSSSTRKWIARHLTRFPRPAQPSSPRTAWWHLTAHSWDASTGHWFRQAEGRWARVSRPRVNRKRSGTGLQLPLRLPNGTSSQATRGTWTRQVVVGRDRTRASSEGRAGAPTAAPRSSRHLRSLSP